MYIIHRDLKKRPDFSPSAQKPPWEINIQDEQWTHLLACELAGCQEACEFLGLFFIW